MQTFIFNYFIPFKISDFQIMQNQQKHLFCMQYVMVGLANVREISQI